MADESFDQKLLEINPRAPLRYYLGEFALAFAGLEKIFHVAFDQLSGLEARVARALAANSRLPELRNLLMKIYPERGPDGPQMLEFSELMQHIDNISKFRHRLIHVGVGGSDPELFSASPFAARTPESADVWKFRLADIKAATSDIQRIAKRLLMLARPDFEMLRMNDPELYAPWLYRRIEPTRQK